MIDDVVTRLPGHESLLTDIITAVRDGLHVLLTGPRGTGRSTLLRALTSRLADDGSAPLEVNARTISADALRLLDPPRVVVIDELEAAEPAVVSRLRELLDDHVLVAAFESDRHHRAYTAEVLRLAYGEPPPGSRRFHLELRDDAEIERFLHEHHDGILPSSLVHAVTELAMGRPLWALDLLRMAEDGRLTTFPHPAIASFLTPGEHPLPALQSLRTTFADLSPDVAAVAIALAEIDPLDDAGIAALAAPSTLDVLVGRGVLLPVGTSGLLRVPALIAAALRQLVPLQLVDVSRHAIARRLAQQELAGLPLSERDLQFCARHFDHEGESNAALVAVHRRVALRAVSRLTKFADASALRGAVVQLAAHDLELPEISRARALATLDSPAEALTVLADVPSDRPRTWLAARFLRHVIEADSGEQAPPGDAPTSDEHRAAIFVFERWTANDRLDADRPRLQAIAERHPDTAVAMMAATLIDLDDVWNGRVPRYTSTVDSRPRTTPAHEAPNTDELTDLAATILLAQALTLTLAGEAAVRQDELDTAIARVPARSHHQRWLRHLRAATDAIIYGDLRRAELEWRLFLEATPRLVPRRLRTMIESVESVLGGIRSATTAGPDASGHAPALLYVATLHGSSRLPEEILDLPVDAPPVLRLAARRRRATRDRNPAELLRVAEGLRRYRMLVPSVHAVREARSIYLGRRASGKVRECDEILAELARQIEDDAPWYRGSALTAELPTPLTERELEVARLAAEGLRNREIAERLECSVRTVESHLAQARAKLGAKDRRALARLLTSERAG